MATITAAEKVRLVNSIRNVMAGAGEILRGPPYDDYYVRVLDSVLRDLKWIYANADVIKAAVRGSK